jgi:hypothetical protein
MRLNLKSLLLSGAALIMWVNPAPALGPDTLWTLTYGERLDSDYSYSVRENAGGGYIVTGVTKAFVTNDEDILLMRIDANGDTLWTRRYGGAGADQGRSVQETPDGGYIIGGWTESFGAVLGDLYLIRVDSVGDTLWTGRYGGDGAESGYCIDQTSDGGYIMGGYSSSWGAGGADAYLVKTDANGDTLWTRTFGGPNHDECQSVRQTPDEGYISVGATSSFGHGGYDIYLIKMDEAGDTVWTRTIGGSSADRAYSVGLTDDGGYILVGYTGSFGDGDEDVYLVRTDADGDTLWTRRYGGPEADFGYSVQQVASGGFILAGCTESFGAGGRDGYIIRTDEQGNILWTKTFGDVWSDQGRSVEETADGGYIICGDIGHPTTTRADVHVIRIGPDCSGVAVGGCDEPGLTVSPPEPNPLAEMTSVEYYLPRRAVVQFSVYDAAGRAIRTLAGGVRNGGTHVLTWDGRDERGQRAAPGLYLIDIEVGGSRASVKVVLMR